MDKQAIKHIVKSKEWADVVDFIRKRFNNIKIDKNLPVNEIGQRALAKLMAIDEIEETLNEMEIIANQKDKENIKYV